MTFTEDWYGWDQCNDLCSLAESIKELQGNYVEIGCWEGKSTHRLTNAIYPQKLICNDTWMGNVAESMMSGETHITEIILAQRDVYKTFVENMDKLTRGNFNIVREDCLKWLETYPEKIKFCHIDASHEYESVYKTIELLKPKLVPGAILCGDDYLSSNLDRHDLHGGVERAVKEHFGQVENLGQLWYWKNV